MSDLVVNCSAPYYNLAAHKIADWLVSQGRYVIASNGDPGLFAGEPSQVFLSVIFSWHAPIAREIALRYRGSADVFCGGPGMYALAKWWKNWTGLDCTRGLDMRFDRQRGDYQMTFASRGCPVDCWFCIVPKIEGKTFTLDWDFVPAPMLCDNNLSALPVDFQEHIIRRYQETGLRLSDANSGFEPRTFDDGTYRRWKAVNMGAWRFALDEIGELSDVERMMKILAPVSASRKRVYVLIGNEPIESCLERCRKVVEWGGEPYCQPVLPLNALDRHDYIIRHDWSSTLLQDFARYWNRYLWRSVALNEYNNRVRGPAPFAGVTP